ncbi:MAG: carbohydrate-binding domain-containing protein [Bacteroidales bacterium]|nr:carbohydrate-binding domain-containing protein [Bacteroidales bacterium]
MKKSVYYLPLLMWAFVGCDPIGVEMPEYQGVAVAEPEALPALDGTRETEDEIANTSFDRTIRIVFSPSGDAVVTGDAHGIVTISGNGVTVNNTATTEKVRYELSGTTSDGFLKIYSNNKQALVLDGVSITNPRGAAINNQGKKRCFVVVQGSSSLADGAAYTLTPSGEDEKAAFFSEGQLLFSGSGTLTVTATGKAGITSDDYVRFLASPTVKVTSSAGHGIRGKDAVIVSDGTVEATVSAAMKKAFSSDSLVRFEGGVTTLKVSGGTAQDDEGEWSGSAGIKADKRFEMLSGVLSVVNSGQGGKGISGDADGYFKGGSVTVTVTGSNYGSSSGGGFGHGGPGGGFGWGSSLTDNSVSAKGIKFDGSLYFCGADVAVRCSNHEGIEAKGAIGISDGSVYSYAKDDAINSAGHFVISGGRVFAQSTGNDGLDANGNLYIQGGTVYAIGSGSPELAVDANTEGGYRLYVSGGTLFAIGGLESGASLSQTCYSLSSHLSNTNYALYDSKGSVLAVFKTPASVPSSLVVSGPDLQSVRSGVSVSGGSPFFDGLCTLGGSAAGGDEVGMTGYTGGGGFGPGGGGFGPGRW